jgi:predicted transcriptional regulator
MIMMNKTDLIRHIIKYVGTVDNSLIAEINQMRILKHIFESEPLGISTGLLERKTGMNHETVSIHTTTLTKEGLTTKKNKRAHFHITSKGVEEIRRLSYLI